MLPVRQWATPAVTSVRFIVDRLDELPTRDAQRMFGEARMLVNAWRDAHAILTSRPMLCWQQTEEVVGLQLLDEELALRLVSIAAESDQEDMRRRFMALVKLDNGRRSALHCSPILFGRVRFSEEKRSIACPVLRLSPISLKR